MHQVNMHEAKTQFSKLVALVEQGEEVIVARDGKPVARLVPFEPLRPRRQPGSMRGQFEFLDTFFDPLPEDIAKAFSA